jgi:hypothetical protein
MSKSHVGAQVEVSIKCHCIQKKNVILYHHRMAGEDQDLKPLLHEVRSVCVFASLGRMLLLLIIRERYKWAPLFKVN